jgi:hypothetical protein
MNLAFFQQIETILASERLDAYRQDGVPPATTLARYLWNMALCESLYSPLQMAEIALRNSLHRSLAARCNRQQWYDVITGLPQWQQDQLVAARAKLVNDGSGVCRQGQCSCDPASSLPLAVFCRFPIAM